MERVQLIMSELGKVEDDIFKTRQQNELAFKAREKAKRRRTEGFNQYKPNWTLVKDTQFAPAVSNMLRIKKIVSINLHFTLAIRSSKTSSKCTTGSI